MKNYFENLVFTRFFTPSVLIDGKEYHFAYTRDKINTLPADTQAERAEQVLRTFVQNSFVKNGASIKNNLTLAENLSTAFEMLVATNAKVILVFGSGTVLDEVQAQLETYTAGLVNCDVQYAVIDDIGGADVGLLAYKDGECAGVRYCISEVMPGLSGIATYSSAPIGGYKVVL